MKAVLFELSAEIPFLFDDSTVSMSLSQELQKKLLQEIYQLLHA